MSPFALVVLLATSWALLATSMFDDNVNNGRFYIISDCTNPVSEQTVTVTANQITDPVGVDYTDFGFPDSTVILGTPNTGVVGLVNRTCRDTYIVKDEGRFLFSCFDNGAFACTILLIGQ